MDVVPGASGEATQQALDVPGAGKAEETAHRIHIASRAPPSIAPAEVAALHRWLARIWPAISLGGGAGRGWVAGVMATLLRPAAAASARSVSPNPSMTRGAGDSPVGGQPRTANAPRFALPSLLLPAGGGRIAYLIAFAAVLAVLAFTLWREFRSALRHRARW